MVDITNEYPFTAFNFSVEITRDGESAVMCQAAFAECDGIEMSMEVKTIREGGNNNRQIRMAGPVNYGQLTLKRGMTLGLNGLDLWNWFYETINDSSIRATTTVVLLASDGVTEQANFTLTRCLPVKVKAPGLNAKDGMVAIEELQLAYEEIKFSPRSEAIEQIRQSPVEIL